MTHLNYLWYVLRHKWYVFIAGRALGLPIWQLLVHDLSKFSPAEWGAYARIMPYFGRFKDAPPQWVEAFDRAWAHHWQRNPHHPEFWGDNPALLDWLIDHHPRWATALLMAELGPPMFDIYIKEMVADWYGAGMAQGKPDIAGWYEQNTTRQQSLSEHANQQVRIHLDTLRQRGMIK